MSKESEKCFQTSDNDEKGCLLSPQASLTPQSVESTADQILVEDSSNVVNENSTDETDLLSANSESIPDFDLTKSDGVDGTDQNHAGDSSSNVLNENDFHSAIANTRKAMKEIELASEKSLNFSRNFLKYVHKKSGYSNIFSKKRIRKDPSGDALSCSSEGEYEAPFDVRKRLKNKVSLSSEHFTPSISSESCTPQSTAQCSDSAGQSLSSEMTSGRTSHRSDSLETLVSDRPPTTTPSVNINNSFCHSFMTKRMRKHYNNVFDFEDFKHACSLNSNAYRQLLNIKYISLPISRFLMEDLLDFVDFLNGTELELRESEPNQCPSASEDKQLAFVRDNFKIGVQQFEYLKINNLLEEVRNYIYEQSKSSEIPSNLEEIASSAEPQRNETVLDPKSESICLDLTKPTCKSYLIFSLDRYTLSKIDQDIENIDDPFVAERLRTLNEAIRRLMMRCISDTRMALELCINTKHSILQLRLENYFAGIKFMLDRLVALREDCVLLLEKCHEQMGNLRTLGTLKVKIQVATVLQTLLIKLSEINSVFLEN